MNLKPGDWVDDRYKIVRLLGSGSEGSVFLAFQEKTLRFYAIKEISKEGICYQKESVEIWKRLRHPGLPEVADILDDETHVLIVMEYAEGSNLRSCLDRGVRFPRSRIIQFAVRISDTLGYLHAQSPPIYYGDLKPENIILQKDSPILVDMGSAFLQGSKGKRTGSIRLPDEKQTESHHPLIGEQTGAGCSCNDERHDLYCLGVLLEMLCRGRKDRQLQKLIRRLKGGGEDIITLSECRTMLRKMAFQPYLRGALLIVSLVFLVLAGAVGYRNSRRQQTESEYLEKLEQVSRTEGEERWDNLQSAMELNPQGEDAFLQMIDDILEDGVFDREEDMRFRSALSEVLDESGNTPEDYLQKDPAGYIRIAYETGIAYWYFYEGREGRTYGTRWFQKACSCTAADEGSVLLLDKSELYRKIGDYRNQLERYEETGEKGDVFVRYWEDTGLLREKMEQSADNPVIRIRFWQELLSVLVHYTPEFKETGVSKEDMENMIREAEEVLSENDIRRENFEQKKEELEQTITLLADIMERTYQEDRA